MALTIKRTTEFCIVHAHHGIDTIDVGSKFRVWTALASIYISTECFPIIQVVDETITIRVLLKVDSAFTNNRQAIGKFRVAFDIGCMMYNTAAKLDTRILLK